MIVKIDATGGNHAASASTPVDAAAISIASLVSSTMIVLLVIPLHFAAISLVTVQQRFSSFLWPFMCIICN